MQYAIGHVELKHDLRCPVSHRERFLEEKRTHTLLQLEATTMYNMDSDSIRFLLHEHYTSGLSYYAKLACKCDTLSILKVVLKQSIQVMVL